MWLIPYNFLMVWGTLRYCANIHNIARKYWPNRRKATVWNLFLVGTIQAFGFTSIYLGGICAIFQLNPIKIFR